MKRNLRWEKHGDVYVARDEHGWTRYFMWLEFTSWAAVGALGLAVEEARQFGSPNRRKLMEEIAKDWRSR